MNNTGAKIRYIAAVVIYGTIGMILRWTTLPSEVLVLARGSIGSLFVLAYALLRGQRPSRSSIKKNLLWLVLGGAALGLNWVFLFGAYRFTTVAIASLCNYTAPLIVIFLSPFLYKEPLGAKKLLCVAAAAVGICLVSGAFTGNVAKRDITGILLGMGAALCFVGIIICNKNIKDISSYDKVIVQLAVAAAVVLPYVLVMNLGKPLHADAVSVLWMIVLAIVHTGVAYCLYFGSMGELPVQTVALWGYIEPVVSVLCSALILSEPLGAAGAIGAALVLGAAVMSERVK